MTLGLDQADILYMSDVVQICLIFHPPQLHLKTTQKTHRQIQASRVRCTRRRSAAMAERTRHHCCPGCKTIEQHSKLV